MRLVIGSLAVWMGGAVVGITASRYIYARHAVAAVACSLPAKEYVQDQAVLVDVSGRTILSSVMRVSDARIELEKWNSGADYHANKALLPVGFVDVLVYRKSDLVPAR